MPVFKGLPKATYRPKEPRTRTFRGFPYGLNTSVPPTEIHIKELSELVNFMIYPSGRLMSRPPMVVHTSTAASGNPAIKHLAKAPIGATSYELLVDEDDKLYYINAGTPTVIGTLEGSARLMAYKGVVLVLDGSYLKFLDGVAGANLKLAYDDGTGASGHQFDNIAGDDDSTIDMYSGSTVRAAYKFTSQSFDSGYTIPWTVAKANLSKTGSPTGDVTVVLRKQSDDSVQATKTLVAAADLDAAVDTYDITFVSGDITNEMDPAEDYYYSIEYSGGDGSNYVSLHCTDVASGGTAATYNGSWSADTTKTPICSLRPGRPPKCGAGVIHGNCPWLYEDPDNPGWAWYGNQTYLDFSSASGGGYVGAIDDNANNYPIGALASHLDELFVYGRQGQPYLAKLTGAAGSYELPKLYQRAWTTPDCLLSVANDLWAGAGDGVDPLTAIQEFGDVRTFSAADPVIDRFQDYWNTDTAFAGYYPRHGQYWQGFPNYHRIVVGHTKAPTLMEDRIQKRYPWTEYELVKNDFTITGYSWDVYKWTASPNGTNEFYLEIKAAGDPLISTQPDAITRARKRLDEGTAGSLEHLEWDYALDPTASFWTIYVRDNTGSPQTTGVAIRETLIPQGFGTWDGNIYIGGSDGHVYKLDPDEYKDLTDYQMDPRWKGAYIELPFQFGLIAQYQLLASSEGGAGTYLEFFINGRRDTADASIEHVLPISDALTVKDMIMDVKDAFFTVDPQQTGNWGDVMVEARSVMLGMTDITLSGYPLYIGGMILMYEPLEV